VSIAGINNLHVMITCSKDEINESYVEPTFLRFYYVVKICLNSSVHIVVNVTPLLNISPNLVLFDKINYGSDQLYNSLRILT
jgi:hypothetical protein